MPMTPYKPTVRDNTARRALELLGDTYANRKLVRNIFGSSGIGSTGEASLVDFTPIGVGFAADEAGRQAGQGHPWAAAGNLALAALPIPGKAVVRGAARAVAGKARGMMSGLERKALEASRGPNRFVAGTEGMISTRRPSPAGQNLFGDPSKTLLFQGGEYMRANPKAWDGNMGQLAAEPYMHGITGSPDDIYTQGVRRSADNLKFIAERMMSPEDVAASRKWYEVANTVSARKAQEQGLPEVGSHGIMAAFSPQTPWDTNVAKHHRLIDMETAGFDSSQAERLAGERWAANKGITSPKGVFARTDPKDVARIMATPMEALETERERYLKIVLTDAVRNDPKVPIIGLDGKFSAGTDDITWGSGREVDQSHRIFNDPTWDRVNTELSGGGKVPSFYNDIAAPNARIPSKATIDTHSAGASSLFPAGGNDPIVFRAMGLSGVPGGPRGAYDIATNGSKGQYGFHADAHQLAGDEMGMLPREVQSVTWEGVRRLWGKNKKTPELKAQVEAIWRSAPDAQSARKQIAQLLGQ